MDLDEFNRFLSRIPDTIVNDTADIIVETATEYFKESFTRKCFDGNPWEPARIAKSSGSLFSASCCYFRRQQQSYVLYQVVQK